MDLLNKEQYTTDDLLAIIRILRGENGCPWDKVQTHETIKKDLIEEAYEAIEAIDTGNDKMMANELGDVLMQVAFHSVLGEEREAFVFDDVVNEICTKLITRHTHVFGNDKTANEEEALAVWNANKKKEKGYKEKSDALKDVPKNLPALMRAEKLQKRTTQICGMPFGVKNSKKALIKNIEKFEDAVKDKNERQIRESVGDILFSAVAMATAVGVCSETALTTTSDYFVWQVTELEKIASEKGLDLAELDNETLKAMWKKTKKA